MVQPSGEGAARCMRQALAMVSGNAVDYINAHGTSTPIGDERETEAIRDVFGDAMPPINSTKSLTGHSQGATGVHEVIYSLLMMEHDFIAASANIDNLDPIVGNAPIVRQRIDNANLKRVMSNSFGFGGTNATLIFDRFDG
jgi:3-oxoacyl-[acyl-carrier-protein] synthase-1